MDSGISKYSCKICKRDYETYNGIWKHNKKYHIKNNTNIKNTSLKLPESPESPPEIILKTRNKLSCEYCSKILSRIDNLKVHEEKCKLKNTSKIVILEKTIEEMKAENNKINILESKIKKLENNTMKKVINNYNNCGNMITNNKLIINKIGTENLLELKNTEITDIFNKEIESVILFIELINFNERLPENHSFCTTSLESKYLSTYNSETNTIDKDRKKYFFDKLLDTSIKRLEILYNSNKKKIAETRQKQIEENINNLKKMKESSFSNKIMKEMINKLNLLSYNKKEIVKNTWAKDESSDDFQKDLEREDSPRYIEYKKSKEQSNVESSSEFITTDSVAKKVALSLKKTKKPIIKIDDSLNETNTENDVDITKQVFIDMYGN